MPIKSCKICGKGFYAKPSAIKYGWGKYCSSKCQYIGQRTGKFVFCDICRKKIWRTPKNVRNSRSGKFFCCKSCFMSWKNANLLVGENHPNWVGGTFAGRGILERSGIKMVCVHCKNPDERVLAVHHLDRDRKHNKVKNLIWLCHNCHHLVHAYGMKIR